jgi:hypothetical protein
VVKRSSIRNPNEARHVRAGTEAEQQGEDAPTERGDHGQAEHADQVIVIRPVAARFQCSSQSSGSHAGELNNGEDSDGMQIQSHTSSSLRPSCRSGLRDSLIAVESDSLPGKRNHGEE